jgi:hypothetical protein
MRTVHETEALRPSDPVPKHHSSNPQNKAQRLRITFNKLSTGATPEDLNSPVSGGDRNGPPSPLMATTGMEQDWEQNNVTWSRDAHTGDWVATFPPDVSLSSKELDLSLPQLVAVISKQVEWAAQSGEELKAEAEHLERIQKSEWIAKELVLRDHLDSETLRAELEEIEAERVRSLEGPAEGIEEDEEDEDMEGDGEDNDAMDLGGDIPPYSYAPEEPKIEAS